MHAGKIIFSLMFITEQNKVFFFVVVQVVTVEIKETNYWKKIMDQLDI